MQSNFLSFTLILLGTSTLVFGYSWRNEPLCTEGFIGMMEHPTSCKKFLNCDGIRTIIQSCGRGTHFFPRTGECDYIHVVRCEKEDYEERSSRGRNGWFKNLALDGMDY